MGCRSQHAPAVVDRDPVRSYARSRNIVGCVCCAPETILVRFCLLVSATGVMNVVRPLSRRKEITYMTTFSIENENNIVALTAAEIAAGLPERATTFTSEKELQRLAAGWPAERLVEIWNGMAGVKAVK